MRPSAIAEFVDALDRHGLLERVREETDWRSDVGTLARAAQRGGRSGPRRAVLCERVRDYPGHALLVNGCATPKHLAVALGLPPTAGERRVRAHIRHAQRQLREAERQSGAFSAAMPRQGLLALPSPHWHPLDAGRYVGTWHINVTHDPESGSRNVGVYRMQVLDDRHATVSVSPHSHLARHAAKARQRGLALPMAAAIGVAEAVVMAAAAALPYGVCEYGLAGALLGMPVRLRPCATVPCEVPADAQYVLEGHILPDRQVTDGPFFDYAGKASVNRKALLFRLTSLHVAESPVFRGTSVGTPGAEDHQLYAFLAAAGLADFHGNRARRIVQNWLLARRAFRAAQWAGRVGQWNVPREETER